MYYIYEARVELSNQVLFYVGQHGWDGEGIDPLYKGSCKHPSYDKWVKEGRVFISLLEEVDKDNINAKERFWIERYHQLYGAYWYGKDARFDYLAKYGPGSCLNGNLGTPDQLRSKEALVISSKKKSEALKGRQVIGVRNSHNECAEKKRRDTMKEIESREGWGFKSEENRRVAREGRRKKARRCKLSDGFEGNSPEISEHLGICKSTVSQAMTFAFERGSYKLRTGIEFYPIV